MDGYQIVNEALKPAKVRFVIHKHDPRSGSPHYDIRFVDPLDKKLLHSFATPINLLETIATKTLLIKTRDHDPRWLDLKSYRLKVIDSGLVEVKIATKKYFDLTFKGKVISGRYRLFKLKTSRDDHWLLTKTK
jgi:hypothetical protein